MYRALVFVATLVAHINAQEAGNPHIVDDIAQNPTVPDDVAEHDDHRWCIRFKMLSARANKVLSI
jgi:hypothetical protein